MFGWGRWKEILVYGDFPPTWKEAHVLQCTRIILLFCIRYYRGDDKIKGFIFDLIAPHVGWQNPHPS
ncbi:hypothetical protein Pmani_010052 [Petrolisthes manimaculis]|uniref:Uncharacterized protein n=1 Tax=Petrolisthes manimaculis TaxID=1843537 RepID=A0AAE1UHQ4_9EUCA|nr:hypothetical protein Pmani_010052 [Petrolisthes manimaculis]